MKKEKTLVESKKQSILNALSSKSLNMLIDVFFECAQGAFHYVAN